MDSAPQAILHWDRGVLGVECERGAVVQAGVEAYLGRSVFAADGSLLVRIKLARHEQHGSSHVVASVTHEDAMGTALGERTVSGDASCASLDEPLTLVVALLVDAPARPSVEAPDEVTAPPGPVSAPAAPPEPPSDETDEIATTPSLDRATQPGHAAVLASGVLSMGLLPATAAGASALLTLKPRGFWGLGVKTDALFPQRKSLGAGSLETSLFMVSGSLCPLQGVDGAAWWSACGNVGAARLRIESRGLSGSIVRREWFAVSSLSARAAWIAGRRLLLGGGIEAIFPVSTDRYVYRDPEGNKLLAFEPGRVALAANLGAGLLLD
jgi:hypothetical protein